MVFSPLEDWKVRLLIIGMLRREADGLLGSCRVVERRSDWMTRPTQRRILYQDCHGMTFRTSFSFIHCPLLHSRIDSFSFCLFSHFGHKESKAQRHSLDAAQTTSKDQLLLTWSWHLPPVDNVPTLSQLLHAISVLPAHHDLCQGHSCPITSTEQLYTVQVSTTRRSTKTKDSNNYLDTNVWDRRSN